MSPRAPSAQQIAAEIDAVLKRDPEARLIGLRSPVRRSWPGRIQVGGRHFDVVWCDSGLELRQRIMQLDGVDARAVVLTSLDQTELGNDLVARFARARLSQADSWQMLRTAFQAHAIDSRLSGQDWLPDLLLEHAPPEGYPPLAGGVLDADTAWRHALKAAIGLTVARPDAEALLVWTLEDGSLVRFSALHDSVRHAIMARIEEQAGPAGSLVMGAVHSGHGAEALPLGLLCGVVFADDTPELREAAVRVEPYFGGARIQTSAAVALAEAASRVVQSLAESNTAAVAQRCHTRAAELLRSLHVAEFVGLSPVLAAGFDARLKAAAEALSAALNSNDMAVLTAAEAAVKHALKHQEAPLQGPRSERLAMALRLLRWLRTSERKSSNFERAAQCYVREGSFVDFARVSLIGGDEIGALAGVYGRIVTTASQQRERENRAFAEHLRLWNAKGTVGDSVVPVERLLDLVVAPLAMDTPILLIVLDGLSFAIHRRLLTDMLHLGWSELVPEEQSEAPPVVAALPTITEVSRASLLCGRLTRGSAAEERKGLAEHAALVRASRAGAPPVLFHKGDLGSGLAEDVRATIADTTRRVIAVVYNAVDAQLAGSDQLLLHWRLDDMPLLRVLLREARDAGRVVVLTGDHGHIIDQGTTQRTCEGGDRWRPMVTPPGEGEIAFEGGRVLAPDGGRSAVLLWTEAVRYAGKRRGYHGGASPQEVLAPLAVLARELAPAGWAPAPPVQPDWWEELTSADASLVSPQHPAKTKGHEERQQFLFHEEVTATTADWIKELFSTPTYVAQKQLAGRGVPSDDQMRRLLDALDASGGRLSQTALAQSMRQPVLRMSGLVSAAARVLNVDQSPVLRLERSTNAVTLDRALLRAQFALRRR